MNKTNDNHTISEKKRSTYRMIAWLVTIIIIIGGMFIYHNYQANAHPYQQYTQAESIQRAKVLAKTAAKTNRLEYDVVYGGHCEDCESIQKQMKPLLAKANKNQSLIMYNTDRKQIRELMLSNNIHATPTIIVQYKGYILYRYTGTDMNIIRQLFDGINPQTEEKFNSHEEYSYYQDDTNNTSSLAPKQRLNYKNIKSMQDEN